jgi:murein DD-endopeptidase MepM/ murein hydrolase activator NlpD
MDKENYTFYIIANNSADTKKFVVARNHVRSAIIVGILVATSLAAILIDYTGLLVQTAENKRLRSENSILQKQFQQIEVKLTSLESTLERVKTFTTKLKLITNIEGEDRSLKLTMGANPAPNQNVEEYDVPADKRVSTEELAKQDAEFVDAPVQANEQKGELAIDTGRDYKSLAVRIDRSIKDSQLREQSVLDLWESLSERQSLLNSTPNIKPAKGWFTSKFGYRLSPFTGKTAFHNGLDIAAAPGSPVYAPADGIVTYAGYDQGYGKLVSIDHGYGVMTRFGHNSQLYVQVGQKVSRWDVIAAVGNTGRSTGAHLHYEVRVNGIARDPAIYILDE